MAPGFDLFNHSDALEPGSTHSFDSERRALVTCATHRHAKGEQAFISYGHASNGSLLLGGGFTLAANKFDSVEISLSSDVDAQRLTLFMMSSPDVPPPSELPQFEFTQMPTDEQADWPTPCSWTRPTLPPHVCLAASRISPSTSLVCAGG